MQFILSIFGIISLAFSDLASFQCQTGKNISVPQATQLLEQTQKRYQGIKSIRANFIQNSYLAALDSEEQSGGKVLFQTPGQMRWHYLNPEEQIFTLKDNVLWFYQVESKQAVVDKADQVLMSELPVAFLLGLGDLTRDFQVESSCQTISGTLLSLNPKSKDSQLKSFQLLIDPQDALPLGASIVDSSDNRTSILLRQLETNVAIDSTHFQISLPKGIDINDRRLGNSNG